MPRTVLVATPKGGVGKTTLSIVGIEAGRARGWSPRVVDVDIAEDGPATSLCTVYTDAVRVRIAPSADDVVSDPLKLYSHWDQLYEMMLADDAWMDFGANVIDAVWGWAADVDLGRRLAAHGVHVDLVVIMTANIEAVQKAAHTIRRFREIFAPAGAMARCFVALSHAEGNFDAVESVPEMQEIMQGGVIAFRFEKAVTGIWTAVEKRRLSPGRVIAMDELSMTEEFELGELQAARGKRLYQVWYERCASLMQGAGLLPAPRDGGLFAIGAANQPVALDGGDGLDAGAFQRSGGKGTAAAE